MTRFFSASVLATTLFSGVDDAHAATCEAGFQYAAFADQTLSVDGPGSATDSYTSGPPLDATLSGADGDIGTNRPELASPVTFTGATAANIRGVTNYAAGVVLTPPTAPSPLPPPGAIAGATYAPGSYGPVAIGPTETANLSAGTYVMASLDLRGSLNVTSGPVYVYLTGDGACLDMNGSPTIDVVNRTASNLIFYVTNPACTTVRAVGGANAAYAIYAPRADVTASGGGRLHGALVGRTVALTGDTTIAYDRMLAAFAGVGPSCPAPSEVPASLNEVARSGPVVAEVGTSGGAQLADVLGTYAVYDPPFATPPTYTSGPLGSFTFPVYYGHLRAYQPGELGATGTAFATADAFWDANVYLEGLATDSRTIFTNTTTGTSPTRVAITDANASVLASPLGVAADDAPTLIGAIRRGWSIAGNRRARLGGVDRSTAAVIEASPQTATHRDRPKMVYVGALDGMLHAICAETHVAYGCTAPGVELWAFVPRTQLGRLRTNTARVDGSPKVADVFGSFGGAPGRSFHTVLTFQTGVGTTGDDAPAAYALDVTDPSAPVLLWERVLDGPGLGTAMGSVRVGVTPRELTFISASVASGVGALQVTAVDSITGEQVWQATRTNTLGAPVTALPGGVAAVDALGDSDLTDVLATAVDGRIFRFSASTGQVPAGVADPLVAFADANHPFGAAPTMWRDSAGVFHVLAASGGYVDTTMLTTVWAPLGTNQFVVSVPITRATTLVLDGASVSAPDAAVVSGGAPDFAKSYGTTTRAFAQITIAGGTYYVVTDSDVEPNAAQYGLGGETGRLTSGRLSNGVLGPGRALGGGVGAADVVAGVAYAGGGKAGVEAEAGMDTGDPPTGGAELTLDLKAVRQLWLRMQ